MLLRIALKSYHSDWGPEKNGGAHMEHTLENGELRTWACCLGPSTDWNFGNNVFGFKLDYQFSLGLQPASLQIGIFSSTSSVSENFKFGPELSALLGLQLANCRSWHFSASIMLSGLEQGRNKYSSNGNSFLPPPGSPLLTILFLTLCYVGESRHLVQLLLRVAHFGWNSRSNYRQMSIITTHINQCLSPQMPSPGNKGHLRRGCLGKAQESFC
ncbi:uncharacterized protein LOC124086753 [Marmota monax]|uniref:Uncharacterized protein n=1 Tax=Marmota monax TaxID=9995 RepID=A0A5E4A4S0_MARMO|nr:uncharacterized protein LOC124086753 [Marmota monax]KAF7467923.1 uncharacterized protein GHT09_000550 [Marmota monax]VTJ52104.1 Hypothetical predicted protein [Marmota monax]